MGIGFGMPITKMIVEKHSGNISLSSVEGEGTEFVIDLPLLSD